MSEEYTHTQEEYDKVLGELVKSLSELDEANERIKEIETNNLSLVKEVSRLGGQIDGGGHG